MECYCCLTIQSKKQIQQEGMFFFVFCFVFNHLHFSFFTCSHAESYNIPSFPNNKDLLNNQKPNNHTTKKPLICFMLLVLLLLVVAFVLVLLLLVWNCCGMWKKRKGISYSFGVKYNNNNNNKIICEEKRTYQKNKYI